MVPMEAVIAANRFGLGARRGELREAAADPRGWLRAQLDAPAAAPEIERLAPAAELLVDAQERLAERFVARRAGETHGARGPGREPLLRAGRRAYLAQVHARVAVAVRARASFRERLVHFWSNHFAVSADKPQTLALAGTLEHEVIRTHLEGSFAQLLRAVERHPAMILYLDNQRSVGPGSALARRAARFGRGRRKPGLNENLAREILELHTLGVDGGYTQADVTELARALTGWSVGGGPPPLAEGEPGRFAFRARIHEPGARRVLGRVYPEGGVEQPEAVLDDLARHPATAWHVGTKLVRHFVADDPPPDAVGHIARVFTETGGHLPSVHRALVDLEQAWAQPRAKLRTPNDLVLASLRAVEMVPERPDALAASFTTLGQPVWMPGSPAGWPDTAAHWSDAGALLERIDWTIALGERIGDAVDARVLAPQVLGPRLDEHTALALRRAASGAEALALLLGGPEFQWR